MDLSKDGGSFDAVPPISGLGNFKGVMLCNRPVDDASKGAGGVDGTGPFKSMISATHGEQIGLTPIKNFEPTVKRRGPSAALRRHVQWLKELQDQLKDERQEVEEEEKHGQERKSKMKAVFEKQREAVRQMMQERDASSAPPPANTRPPQTVQDSKPKPKASKSKPLWAMTSKEKDDFEEDEADDLIGFAEGLDFDKYINDLEFRQGMHALKDRTGKLQKEQDAFKDALVAEFNEAVDDEERSTSAGGSPRGSKLEEGVDGVSLLGSEYSAGSAARRARVERKNPDGRDDWDNSTALGDDRPQVDYEVKDAAVRALESNPQLRAVHSKESVAKIIEKAKEKQAQEPTDLISTMRREGPAKVPVIVASADMMTRLHKPPDPSCLPYLYRSPAI